MAQPVEVTLEEREVSIYLEVVSRFHGIAPGLLTSRYGSRRPKGSRVAKARALFQRREGITWDLTRTLAQEIHESTWEMKTLTLDPGCYVGSETFR